MAEIKVEPKIVPLTSAMQEAIHKLNEVGDSFEVIGSALDIMMNGGCGQPGHTTCTNDEGTSYCLTCELQGQNNAKEVKSKMTDFPVELRDAYAIAERRRKEIDALKAERDALLAVLKPFAKFADVKDHRNPSAGDMLFSYIYPEGEAGLKLSECIKAQEVIDQAEKGDTR